MGSSQRGSGIRNWWRRVTDGLTVRELWQEFRREAGASYRLYSRELEDQLEDQPRWRRWWATMRALATAMLMRLSPARRVFLLLALLLMVWPHGEHSSGLAERLAGLMLFGLLVMELADWVTMKRDLELAREIQQWLVPHEVPRIPGVDCAFVTQPANTVAGDYYDVFLRPTHDGNPAAAASAFAKPTPTPQPSTATSPVVLVVADVAGKSMPAALLMATFQASLRTLMFEPLPLQRVVGRLNRYAFEHSLEGRRFTTAFLAELDLPSGRLTYVNAGHNAPILRRANGAIERLETGGLLLGVREPIDYEAGKVTLSAGDTLVIFTDGVADARSRRGEQFGEHRLVELMQSLPPDGPAGLSAQATLQRVLRAVDVHVQDAPQEDDVTCLVLRYQGAGAPPTA